MNEIELALELVEDIPAGQSLNYRRERILMLLLVAEERGEEADVIADWLLSSASASSNEFASMIAADHYFRTGRHEPARDVLREIIQANPSATDARNALARIEFADGNVDIAEGLLTTVIQSDSVNLVALLELARIAELRGDKENMVVLLEQAASAHEQALVPRVVLIREYLMTNQPDKAERLADELIATGFSNARIGEIVANVFAQVGRMDDALAQFQKAARLDPKSSSIQSGIARVNFALGRTVAARQALERALEITPGWPPAMTGLALIAVSQGRIEDALRLVQEFKSLHPDNPAAFVLEGEVLLYQKDFSGAAKAFERAVGRGAGRPAVLRQYQARVSAAMPNPESTLVNWLSENGTDSVARKYLAQHYQLNDRGNEAIAEYEKLLEYSPDDAIVLNNIAWQYQQKNDLERAVEFAEKAHTINPESGSIADTLGWIYYDLGQLGKSLELLVDASRLSPENGEIQYHLAVALTDSGDREEARRVLEQLQESDAQFPSRDRASELLGQL
jgi:putative PEP-CTERM system TPR-repeat lipoprotein